jgi:hypothetical protein
LRDALGRLEAVPEGSSGRRLRLEEGREIDVDLSYEIGELRKDLRYLEDGEEALLDDLAGRHPDHQDEMAGCIDALQNDFFQTLISDRDGTVNNYCGRYRSSVQSVYNAVFLSRFARAKARRSVILTSAPLLDVGIADVSVTPVGAFVLAGSKGREYLDPDGERHELSIDLRRQIELDILNERLDGLLKEKDNQVFTLIGSGLQHKFGQTTIARGDIAGSVSEERSLRFLGDVRRLVGDVDPEETFFRIEDTGLDIEIVLTLEDDEDDGVRDFDKGDGVRFLDADVPLAMAQGTCLVCGDTASDVPMLEATLEIAPHARAVFVTGDEDLRRRVATVLPAALFVSEPDTLVAALNALSGGTRG